MEHTDSERFYVVGAVGCGFGILAVLLTLFSLMNYDASLYIRVIRDFLLISWPLLQSLGLIALHRKYQTHIIQVSIWLHWIVFALLLVSYLIRTLGDIPILLTSLWIAIALTAISVGSVVCIALMLISLVLILSSLRQMR